MCSKEKDWALLGQFNAQKLQIADSWNCGSLVREQNLCRTNQLINILWFCNAFSLIHYLNYIYFLIQNLISFIKKKN